MTCIKEGQMPLRFNYIQDGRSPNILHATRDGAQYLGIKEMFKELANHARNENDYRIIGPLRDKFEAEIEKASDGDSDIKEELELAFRGP